MEGNFNDVFEHIDQRRDEYIRPLQTLVRQPSVAAQNLGMSETAELVIYMLGDAGIEATTYDTRGGFPVVYGELTGRSAKRLSFYNHYDVQPAEPLELWTSDPWTASIRD